MTARDENAGPRWTPQLGADERLLWQGAPDPGLRFNLEFSVASAFGLIFLAIGVFEAVRTLTPISAIGIWSLIFALPAVAFIVVGLFLLFGTYLSDAARRRATRYALTSKAAYIKQFSRKDAHKQAFPITAATDIELRQTLPPSVFFADRFIEHENETERRRIGFEFIADAEQVFAMMRQIQQENP